jgi:hypothetical protein
MRTRIPDLGCAVLSAICFATIAFAQSSWWRTYGGTSSDWGSSVHQTSDGGYIIIGATASVGAGYDDVYLIKTDAAGDTVWTRTYGGAGDDCGYSVQPTSGGGYIVTGSTSLHAYLVKADASGDTLWTRTYGDTVWSAGNSVQQTTDGGYIVAGFAYSFRGNDFYLIKTDGSGDALWTRTYGGADGDVANSVQQTTDGGYIIAGGTMSFGAGNLDVYLVKTDSSGDTLWTRTYGGTSYDEGYSVRQTLDSGYIIAGRTGSFGAGSADVYLIKTSASGDTLWTRTYGGMSSDG